MHDDERIVNLLISQIEEEYKATMKALLSDAKPDSLLRLRAHIATLVYIRRSPYISILNVKHLQNRVMWRLGLLMENHHPLGSVHPTGKSDVEKLIDELRRAD